MKKMVVLAIFCCLLVAACGTGAKEQKSADHSRAEQEDTQVSGVHPGLEQSKAGLVSKEYRYEKNHMNYHVTYPALEADRDGMNEKITAFAMETVDELGFETPLYNEQYDCYEERTIDEKYEMMFQDEATLSIAITGYYNVKGTAHPLHTARVLNLDLQSGEEIRVQDTVTVDERFADKLLASAREQLPEDLYSYIQEQGKDRILEYCRKADTMYFLQNGVGIYYEVIHPFGDYVKIEIR